MRRWIVFCYPRFGPAGWHGLPGLRVARGAARCCQPAPHSLHLTRSCSEAFCPNHYCVCVFQPTTPRGGGDLLFFSSKVTPQTDQGVALRIPQRVSSRHQNFWHFFEKFLRRAILGRWRSGDSGTKSVILSFRCSGGQTPQVTCGPLTLGHPCIHAALLAPPQSKLVYFKCRADPTNIVPLCWNQSGSDVHPGLVVCDGKPSSFYLAKVSRGGGDMLSTYFAYILHI